MESEAPDKPVESRFPWQYWLLGALILYPLSLGPAGWLMTVFPALENATMLVYSPLFMLCEQIPVLKQFVGWYFFELWQVPLM
jgi:hypothetical protein